MTTPNTENVYHVFLIQPLHTYFFEGTGGALICPYTDFIEIKGYFFTEERLQCSPQQPLHTFFTALLLSTPYLGDLDPSMAKL